MPFFEKDFIQRVVEATDLVELVRGYVPALKRQGERWVAPCPFHQERTGSFGVRPKKHYWKCFGCGAGGDAVRFVMMFEGIPFPDAVKKLAARAALPLPDGSCLPAPPREKQRKRSREEVEREQEEKRLLSLAMRSQSALPGILERYPWERCDMWESTMPLPEDEMGQARALLGIFQPSDIVWCGLHGDTISEDDAADPDMAHRLARIQKVQPFRMAREWISSRSLPGPRICPSAFKPNVLARANDTVLHRRFLVIEHDKVSIEHQGALLRWLNEAARLRLRAVVFTGGKSLHGWFDCPMPARLRELQTMLIGVKREGENEWIGGMGFDPATFVPSQSYRVPGWKHEKTNQPVELCYLGGPAK